eukprot:461530-Prymnesium_polylepis.1
MSRSHAGSAGVASLIMAGRPTLSKGRSSAGVVMADRPALCKGRSSAGAVVVVPANGPGASSSHAFEVIRTGVRASPALAEWRNEAVAARKATQAKIRAAKGEGDLQAAIHSEEAFLARGELRRDARVLDALEAHWQAASRTMLWHRGGIPARPAPPGCDPADWRPTAFVATRRASVGTEYRRRGAVFFVRLSRSEYVQVLVSDLRAFQI